MISAQSLHHFIANSPWLVEELKEKRLKKILKALNGQAITVVIDETGDRKKGKKTDYAARQSGVTQLPSRSPNLGALVTP